MRGSLIQPPNLPKSSRSLVSSDHDAKIFLGFSWGVGGGPRCASMAGTNSLIGGHHERTSESLVSSERPLGMDSRVRSHR